MSFKKSRILTFFISVVISFAATSSVYGPSLNKKGVVSPDNDSFYDGNLNYTEFPGRVTDKDKIGNILKLETENKNIKFLRSGDQLKFKVFSKKKEKFCEGTVRGVEEKYLTVFVKDINECWSYEEYFRRGTLVSITVKVLEKRVKSASYYRQILLKRKQDYLQQLNETNNFLWNFNQQKVKVAAEYDLRINQIKQDKQRAMDELIIKNKDASRLQQILAKKLDQVDRDIDHYQVERQEVLINRWALDHDLGKPVKRRPQKIKVLKEGKNRWLKKKFFQ